MKFALRFVGLALFIISSLALPVSAQSSRVTARFFKVIQPQFRYQNQKIFNQKNLENILKQEYRQLVPVGPRASERLFKDSQLFTPSDSGVFYYAYNESYGDFYQIVLCIQGPYSPSLVLMSYAQTGRLLNEVNLAGNFIDGGQYFVWNSKFENDATLIFNFNSYYQKKDKGFYCDSSLTNYAIRKDGFLRPMTHKKYTVKTTAVRGNQLETIEERKQICQVFAPSGLKLRKTLDRRSRSEVVPYGASIEVLRTSRTPYLIDWIQGNWAYVRHDSTEGYMFDGYLSTLKAPAIDSSVPCKGDYAGLLLDYINQYLPSDNPIDTIVSNVRGPDSLKMHITQNLRDSLQLDIFRYENAKITQLTLPESQVEEAYILLQALLTPCNDTEILNDEILFVKNRGNRIYKIYDREGRVSITEGKRNKIMIRMQTALLDE